MATFRMVLLCSSGFLLSPFSLAASFDCDKAETVVERKICDIPVLSELDDILGRSYSPLRKSLKGSDVDELKANQRAWLKERNACSNASCILDQYIARITKLCFAFGMPHCGDTLTKLNDYAIKYDTNESIEDTSTLKVQASEAAKEFPVSEFGFRDIKPGIRLSDVGKHCRPIGFPLHTGLECYGLDFVFAVRGDAPYLFDGERWHDADKGISDSLKNDPQIDHVTIDTGRVYFTGLIDSFDAEHPYTKRLSGLRKKYNENYKPSTQDIAAFESRDINAIYHIFENGQVALALQNIRGGVHVIIEYRSKSLAEEFIQKAVPKTVSNDDF